MKLLYIGDIMGKPGREVTARLLPEIKAEHQPDVILAQAENATHGKGISLGHYQELQALGVDGFMSGNHIFALAEIIPYLQDPNQPITRPANCPEGTPGQRYKYLQTGRGQILLITLMGQIVGMDADKPVHNPLHIVDEILDETKNDSKVATIVNFHGDYSSEKVVIGQYLDGRVAAVIGDHWHVPTADARILPGGTAHISDVGMVGTRNSCLGVKTDVITRRWFGLGQGRNELAEVPPYQFCSVLIDIDETTGLSRSIESVLQYLDT